MEKNFYLKVFLSFIVVVCIITLGSYAYGSYCNEQGYIFCPQGWTQYHNTTTEQLDIALKKHEFQNYVGMPIAICGYAGYNNNGQMLNLDNKNGTNSNVYCVAIPKRFQPLINSLPKGQRITVYCVVTAANSCGYEVKPYRIDIKQPYMVQYNCTFCYVPQGKYIGTPQQNSNIYDNVDISCSMYHC